jgi:hypothetical protein
MAGTLLLDCIVGCDDEERFEEVVVRGAGNGDFEASIAMVDD